MSATIATATAECPECAGEWTVTGVTKGEIIQCPERGAELEVIDLEPFTLTHVPEEDEDWGK
jgi:alpha-aminoadipate carrier protein LysW